MKALIIKECRDCPHVEISCLDRREDDRIVSCSHPEAPEHDGENRRLNRVWEPFYFCPLPNYNPDGTDSAT
jgi:hypothetical protein